MKNILVFCFIIHALAITNTQKKNKISKSKQVAEYYLFAFQYVDGFCSERMCPIHSAKSKWTIHGLWPNSDSMKLKGCKNEQFNHVELSEETKSKLKDYWITLSNKHTDHTFHNHEWGKHGTCVDYNRYGISDKEDQSFYFSKTIELYELYNPGKFISKKNYTIKDLEDLLKINYGHIPFLKCTQNNDGYQMINEIRVKFDLDFMLVKQNKRPVQECISDKLVKF
jgi:ribonuclease I